MPFLPSLFTVIGIGLQCHKEVDTIPGDQHRQHVVCNEDTSLFDVLQWDREIAILPPKVSNELQKYESQLKMHLADYSKFCVIGIRGNDE